MTEENTDQTPKKRTRTAARSRKEPMAASSEAEAKPSQSVKENSFQEAPNHQLVSLDLDDNTIQRIVRLPKDVGWLLITAGIVGVILPGVPGMPFLVLGGLVLTPGTKKRTERWLNGHSPKLLKGSARQINRFLDDLEKRYPSSQGTNIRQ
jgi:hypothetical protein